jgi:hypothetical protein
MLQDLHLLVLQLKDWFGWLEADLRFLMTEVALSSVTVEKCVICGALIPVTGPDNEATRNKQCGDPTVP